MIRKSVAALMILTMACGGRAVTRLTINNSSNYLVTLLPAKIVLFSDGVSPGNTLSCEIFMDVNGNNDIDTYDQCLAFFRLQDGLGWVRDAGLPDEGIPGDETPKDGCIQTTLRLDENLRAYSSQTWIVRMTEDNSVATALLTWRLPPGDAGVTGIVLDKDSRKSLSHVLVRLKNNENPDIERLAVADEKGEFAVDLFPGKWVACTSSSQNQSYRPSKPFAVAVRRQRSRLTLYAEKYKSFIEGRVCFENKSAVENVTIALQNTNNFEIYRARTDENGYFKIGVDPGQYVITTTEYSSIYLGNHYWPEGFYADPAVAQVSVAPGEIVHHHITFSPYPAFIRGVCTQSGAPLQDVLVQGVAVDPQTGEHRLYQTFSNADGSFSLGVEQGLITSVVAQKEGGYIAENATFRNIDMRRRNTAEGYNFNFSRTASMMSLSGAVYKGNRPVEGVYVVAFNSDNKRPESHLVAKTDENGAYYFDIKIEGDWQIGIYEDDHSVHPQMYYKYLSPGLKYRDLDFVLSGEGENTNRYKGELQLADFNLAPHFPNPFYKETIIDFVLPKSSYTQIDVIDMDGEEVTSLVNDKLSSGYQKVRWDGTDDQGNVIANGVYFCRMKSQEKTTIQPITLLR